MTFNGVIAVTLRYFIEFGKPPFQLITTCSSIEPIDKKSASITRRTVKLVCVSKFTHSVWTRGYQYIASRYSYLLIIYRLSFTLQCFDA